MPRTRAYQERKEIWEAERKRAGYTPTRLRPCCKICKHSRIAVEAHGIKIYCKQLRGAPVSGGAICRIFERDKEKS